MTSPEVSDKANAVLPIFYFLYISFPFSHCCVDLCWDWLLGSDVTMALKKVLRSYDLQIIKDFGISESLPLRPLLKCDILARYSSIRQNSVNIPVLTDWQIAYKLVEEIEDLYKKFGLKTVTKVNATKKVLAVKSEYYKWRKKVHSKTFPSSDPVSFRAPKQPREVLKDDINWYEAKLRGEAGCLGSVDRKANERSLYRVKRKSMAENTSVNINESEDTLENMDLSLEDNDSNSMSPTSLSTVNEAEMTPQSKRRQKCKKIDWSPVVKTAQRWNVSNEALQEILVSYAEVVGIDSSMVPSDTTLYRRKKDATVGIRDRELHDMKENCNSYILQFDGKDTNEAVLISGVSTDGNIKTMPLDVKHFKSHPTGKAVGEHLAQQPVDHSEVLALVCDTTTSNSGTGKKGGACYWYQQLTQSLFHSDVSFAFTRVHCWRGSQVSQFQTIWEYKL